MEQDLQSLFIFSLTIETALANLAVALLSGVLISLFYRATYNGVSYSKANVLSIVMLTMVTALVIMVIGNNLARAFGLVGAMSIIRFRTSVKHTQDIMYIFFALAAGLAAGAGMYAIVLAGTVFIGLAMMLLSELAGENPAKREYLLQLVYRDEQGEERPFSAVFEQHCSKHKLVNVKTVSENEHLLEMSFYIVLKKEKQSKSLVTSIKALTGVQRVNLFFDEN
jgi:uncharacterized membrane protein YhiD involved in acid resistance